MILNYREGSECPVEGSEWRTFGFRIQGSGFPDALQINIDQYSAQPICVSWVCNMASGGSAASSISETFLASMVSSICHLHG